MLRTTAGLQASYRIALDRFGLIENCSLDCTGPKVKAMQIKLWWFDPPLGSSELPGCCVFG
jgi:hypothetical protein